LPGWLTELLVAIAATGLFVGLRLMANPWLGGNAPFSLATVAMVLAALLAGWRSGAMSLVLGLLLIWFFVLPPQQSFHIESGRTAFALAVAFLSETVILLALAVYQRAVRAGEIERARRINFLGHALREMDHRTKNNFQIVTSLLTLQGSRSAHPEVQIALSEAAERLKAVAAVYDALAPSSQGLATVRLQDQLEEISGQIRRGILPDGIRLETELEPMLVPHETAVAIGIVVNELVTNACKHAFPDGAGKIFIRALKVDDGARIEVSDDGKGFVPGAKGKSGLGTRLVAAFVKRMGGHAELHSAPGKTTHVISVPLRNR
jgi:two-component system, sensor histidine kinase PdtaS